MAKKTYLVRFKNPAISTQPLVAHRAEIQGDHIVMFDSDGGSSRCFGWRLLKAGPRFRTLRQRVKRSSFRYRLPSPMLRDIGTKEF